MLTEASGEHLLEVQSVPALANRAVEPTAPPGRFQTLAVAHATARKAVRSGVILGLVVGLYVLVQAFSYTSTYKTSAERAKLASTLTSGGLSPLVGPARQVQTVAGYTAWKCLMALTIIGAIWGLLTATKLLRGEEDSGRWELMLAGLTTRRRAALQAVLGLGAGWGALLAVASAITVAVGRASAISISAPSMLFFSLSVASSAAMFLGIGALTSQLAASRRQAAALAAAALGVSFALRMAGDSSPALGWLRWASPLGWVEELRPLTSPQPLALGLIAAFSLSLLAGSVYLAGVRDLAASVLPAKPGSRPRTALLSGPVGLAMRLTRATTLAWLVGIATMAWLLGSETKVAVKALQDSPSVQKALSRLSGTSGQAKVYLGLSFVIVALLISLLAIGHLTAARKEESSGRLDHLLVAPISRSVWLASRLLLACAVVTMAGVMAGVVAWLGTGHGHDGIGLSSMADGGLNTAPPAICLIGFGALAIGFVPRWTSLVLYGVLAWSFLVELVGGLGLTSHWLLDTSVLHHMRAAPALAPNWTSGVAMIAVALTAGALGIAAFGRRDLAGD
jgi:ABC-2 type transport system permease protein